ncbi:amidohydrolase family protein [Roseibium aestuarii]|uniref:Amidohydrolase family protein n=1 Tax=Roseibium aestuarii TaxID=2600299 RepID=A0ABW4JZM1_9HYPH|nr:amidohydrolase family protein [Roseibium aestuarii]
MTVSPPRIDAHQHFWAVERGDYGWLTPDLAPLYRDFLPADLKPHLNRHEIDGTILVQAAPTVAETRFLLELADRTPSVRGVVGWADFAAPDAPDRIAGLAAHPRLVGLRPMIQDIADDDWMLRPDLDPAFRALVAHDLTFDALTLPRHLDRLLTLLGRYPDLRTVIDHGSKPRIRDRDFEDWAASMSRLAQETSAFCKLSGLVTEAAEAWTTDDLRPYTDHLLTSFGPGRLIWGSDWPVCTLGASYDRWVETTETLLADLGDADRAAIMGGNALTAYGLATSAYST